MTDHSVVIAGGGPTGLMLAGELALAGVDVAVVERRPNQELSGARALGISSRTIEVLDQRGIADRFLSAGQTAQVTGFAVTRLDISDFPTRHNYGLALRQKHIERILADWVTELEVPILYGREITGFVQHDAGVDVALADGQSLRAQYLVGCDGGRSLIRKTAGIDFPGWDPTTSNILAEVEMTEKPPYGVHRSAAGMYAFGRSEYEIKGGEIIYKDVGPIGVMVTEPNANATTEPTLRRSQGAAHRRVRHRLRRPQPNLDLQVHGHDAAGRAVSQRTRVARRRRRPRSLADRRAGTQHRRAGRGESRMEAGAGDQGHVTGQPARHVSRRASPGGCARAQDHDGAGRAAPRGRSHTGRARHRGRPPQDGGAAQTHRRDDVRPGHSVRTGAGASAAGTSHARSRRRHRKRSAARLQLPSQGSAGAAQPRRAATPSTSRRGQTAFSTSTRNTLASGNFRCSAKSLRPPRC